MLGKKGGGASDDGLDSAIRYYGRGLGRVKTHGVGSGAKTACVA